MKQYIVGTQIQLAGTFTLSDGSLADPTAVTAQILTPDGEITDLTADIQKTGVGVYVVEYTPDQIGLHTYQFAGTGNVISAGESTFTTQTEF